MTVTNSLSIHNYQIIAGNMFAVCNTRQILQESDLSYSSNKYGTETGLDIFAANLLVDVLCGPTKMQLFSVDENCTKSFNLAYNQ